MSAPVGWTCPLIDSVLKDIQSCLESNDVDEIHDILQGLVGRNSEIEEIRDANATLRDWGERMEQEVILCEERISELEMEYSTLENEYEDVYNHLQEFLKAN